jgi:hypothetical protein
MATETDMISRRLQKGHDVCRDVEDKISAYSFVGKLRNVSVGIPRRKCVRYIVIDLSEVRYETVSEYSISWRFRSCVEPVFATTVGSGD